MVLLISSHLKTIKMNCQSCPMRTTMKQCVATPDSGVSLIQAEPYSLGMICLLWCSVPWLYLFIIFLSYCRSGDRKRWNIRLYHPQLQKNKLAPGIWGSGLFLYLNVSTFCSRRKRVKLSLSTGVGSIVKLMSNSVFYESHHPSGFAVLYCRRNRSSSISEHHYEAIIVKCFPCLTMRWAVRICALREISHLTQVPQRLEWKHCWVLLKDFCIFVCQCRPLRPEVIFPVTVVTSARWQGSVLTCPLAHQQ